MQLPPKVSERAFERLVEIDPAGSGKGLRVAVEGGGCSGFQYDIRLDGQNPDDLVIEGKGQKVFVDAASLPFLQNAVIDFSDELIGARFVIENPNASSSCGCGTSFSLYSASVFESRYSHRATAVVAPIKTIAPIQTTSDGTSEKTTYPIITNQTNCRLKIAVIRCTEMKLIR